MTLPNEPTRVAQLIRRIQDNKLLAAVIVFGLAIIAVAQFTSAIGSLWKVSHHLLTRPPVTAQKESNNSQGLQKQGVEIRSSQDDPIVGRWRWGADPDGRRAQWVTADADGTLESTIVTQGENPPEKLIDSGKWTVLDQKAARYELSWDARGGGFVTRNYVTLSADGQRLVENDKGKLITRGTRY
jgi:hypothetical protein